MDKKPYDPSEIEEKLYQEWESSGLFEPGEDSDSYSLAIPPPNVTGTLHMGHGFQNAIMDCLIRYHRMSGKNTLWQVGTDHAGIATEMVVERRLNAEGKSKESIGREAFEAEVWDWKKYSGNKITSQLRRLGSSLDWSSERFTLDDEYQHAVQSAFIQLFEDGLIYQGKRLVNWDPVLETSLSDLEVVNKDLTIKIWEIKYQLEDSDQFVTVATTRPETLLGDMALAVNPGDERFSHLIGKNAEIPLCNRLIPIVADDYVDPEFGTGVVKITPGHDFNDYELGKRHGLHLVDETQCGIGTEKEFDPISILSKAVKIIGIAPEKFHGMDRFDARAELLNDLKENDCLIKESEYESTLPYGDRSDQILEPLLTDQWYVDAKTLAKPAIEAVKTKEITFVPANWEKTYFQWMDNIQDWCVSRQLWWGHRIPIWYDENGQAFAGHSEDDVRAKNTLTGPLTQEEDVLDTWFSSSLWTFATLGWPEKNSKLELFHPTTALVTGFDIIFFWVARMIMMTKYFMKEVPFKEVYITGLIKDENGQKMSKSKGNILDPIDLIDGVSLEELLEKRTEGMMQPQLKEKIIKQTKKQFPDGIDSYGTDALRYTYYSLASPGRDINFDIGRIKGYRNFCNKIWNAFRFIEMQAVNHEYQPTTPKADDFSDWMSQKINQTSINCKTHIETYRFDLAAAEIYELVWSNFCDWYIELNKVAIQASNNNDETNNLISNLIVNFDSILRLLHPFMPFITEDLSSKLAILEGKDKSEFLVKSGFTQHQPSNNNTAEHIEEIINIISAIRVIRAENTPIKNETLHLILSADMNSELQSMVTEKESIIASIAKLDGVEFTNEIPDEAIEKAMIGYKIIIPLEGLIDPELELSRLTKELNKVENDIKIINSKLSNEQFVAKAPEAVIIKEKEKLASAVEKKSMVESSLLKLNS
ncbi:valine--tRNA ligase [Gammaproteobacteria bacterium]|nr:valine--tRNA ligase [Gammaproteobacteria bacterium]MDB9859840.1 valine--tRNA ligase [Gammaproteobacteria bacterium]MDB9940165.1 valine--tRNA ligase [Gammaproteobacteria bacterium]|tara:strand:+ start:1414 stop:4206 length:2793 start_codon:yes stop_codon:yes gene_type:complete